MGENGFGVLGMDDKIMKSSEVIRFEKAEGCELKDIREITVMDVEFAEDGGQRCGWKVWAQIQDHAGSSANVYHPSWRLF